MSEKLIKEIGDNKQFSKKILEAIKILAKPVKATLGPDGQPILIEKNDRTIFTKDGVSVADSIFVEDPVQNAMIQAIKEAARKTNEMVGDGTTSAIVLTEAIIENAMQFIDAQLISPQTLVQQIKVILPKIIQSLADSKRPIKSEDEIKFVASISANNDSDIASKVAEAVISAGQDGLIQLEDGFTPDIVISKTEGYQIGKGWSIHKDYAPRMLTDASKQEAMFDNNPYLLLYNGALSDFTEFADLLKAHNKLDEQSRCAEYASLVIVAHEFSGQIRQMVADNMSMNGLPVMLVETEMLGTPQSRIYLLDDLAAFSSGKVVQHGAIRSLLVRGNGPTITKVADGWLGRCKKVKQLKGTTTFYGGTGDVLGHVEIIKKQIEDVKSVWDKNLHKKRIAKLVDGIIMVSVGGTTELEIKEKKDRVEDSLNATRAAIKEGIVAGGGVALLRCSMSLSDLDYGATVMKKALRAPIEQIIRNTGQSPDVIVHKLMTCVEEGNVTGYDALNKVMVNDVFVTGIVDPFLVVKTALENAASIGCEVLRGGGYCVGKAKKESSMPSIEDMMAGARPGEMTDEE